MEFLQLLFSLKIDIGLGWSNFIAALYYVAISETFGTTVWPK